MITAPVGLSRTPRVLLAWAALPVVTVAAVLAWLLLESCENSRLREVPSPDGRWKIVVFERYCSGTVAWSTHVSVVEEHRMLPNAPGNVLSSYERHGSLVGASVREPEVGVRWRSQDTIELTYESREPTPSKVEAVGSIRVVHARKP